VNVRIEQMIIALESEAATLIRRNEVLAEAGWPARPDDFEAERAHIFQATANFLRRVDAHGDAVRAVLEGAGA